MRARILTDKAAAPGKPVVLYVPGLDGTGKMLFNTAARLEEHFRLICFAYEFEKEISSEGLYERLADSIVQRMDEAGVTKAVVLAESFGGGVALNLALRHPDRVQGLMLVNTFCYFPQRVRVKLGALMAPFTPTKMLRIGRASLASKVFFRPRKDAHAETGFRDSIPGFARGGYAVRLQAIPTLDLRARLSEISIPCYLYASDSDLVVPSKKTMQVLKDGLPNATLTILKRANHIVLPLSEEPWAERLEALVQTCNQPS